MQHSCEYTNKVKNSVMIMPEQPYSARFIPSIDNKFDIGFKQVLVGCCRLASIIVV